MTNQFRGMGVALVTPFDDAGNIDFAALERLLQHVISHDSDYVVLLGTTGESATLSMKERFDILDFAVQTIAGNVPIVAGFGGNDTRQLIRNIESYHFKGIDAILSVNPSYNRPNQEGIFKHYQAVAAHSPVPILIYNVPSRTASNIKASTAIRIAQEIPNIIGIKEASGDMAQVMHLVKHKNRPDFLVLSGDDLLTLPMLALGCDGVISVIGNALPHEFGEMVHTALNGDYETARNWHYLVSDIIQLLFADGSPAGIKAALSILGICKNTLRLPLVPMQDLLHKELKTALEKLKVTV
jgi:4-hydroxy-tetrahydrodipicolinate synthase